MQNADEQTLESEVGRAVSGVSEAVVGNGKSYDDFYTAQFGGCPACGERDGGRHVGRAHYFYCLTHRTKWEGDSELFSSWKSETMDQRYANWLYLSDFTEVKPEYSRAKFRQQDERVRSSSAVERPWRSAQESDEFWLQQFGGCPKCGGQDGMRNIGKLEKLYCHKHKTKWEIGTNLLSDWRQETMEQYYANWLYIRDYEDVEPVYSLDDIE